MEDKLQILRGHSKMILDIVLSKDKAYLYSASVDAETRDQCHKTFYCCNFLMLLISQSVWPRQAFQPSLIFVGKEGLPESGKPETCFSQLGFGITRKHQTRLERPARDKHSSLFGSLVSQDQKKFNNMFPGSQYYKFFFSVNYTATAYFLKDFTEIVLIVM